MPKSHYLLISMVYKKEGKKKNALRLPHSIPLAFKHLLTVRKSIYHRLCWTVRGYYLEKWNNIGGKMISRTLLTCKHSIPQCPLYFYFHQKPLHTVISSSLKTSKELRTLIAKLKCEFKKLIITKPERIGPAFPPSAHHPDIMADMYI